MSMTREWKKANVLWKAVLRMQCRIPRTTSARTYRLIGLMRDVMAEHAEAAEREAEKRDEQAERERVAREMAREDEPN